MGVSRLLRLLLLKRLMCKKRLQRRWCVRPLHQNRRREGFFNRYVKPMRVIDPEMHFTYFRMTRDTFDLLHRLLEPALKRRETHSMPISSEERLSIALRILASGDQLSSVATAYRIGRTTAAKILFETTTAIWDVLAPDYVKAPNSIHDWQLIAEQFGSNWNFPNCLGAIDGKHVVVQAPAKSGSMYYNYKGSFSIVLMAVVDANYLFRIIKTLLSIRKFPKDKGHD